MGNIGRKKAHQRNEKPHTPSKNPGWCASDAAAVQAAKEALEAEDVKSTGLQRNEDTEMDRIVHSWYFSGTTEAALLTGPPGTGKSRSLANAHSFALSNGIKALWLSCMSAPHGETAFASLSGCTSVHAAQRKLKRLAASGTKVLLLLDEADALAQNSLWVLRELLQLHKMRKAHVCTLMAANRRSFVSPLVHELNEAGIGFETLQFGAFTPDELASIVAGRLSGVQQQYSGAVFQEKALELCCKKVAATSGDARRVLECCCAAIDKQASMYGEGSVGVQAAHAATAERIQPSHSSALTALPQENKVLAQAAANLAQKDDANSLEALVEEYMRSSKRSGLHPVGMSEVVQMCEALSEQGVLSLESSAAPALPSMRMKRKRCDASMRTFQLKLSPEVISNALCSSGD